MYGTPVSGFFSGREIFSPYLFALILAIFKSEIAIRIFQVIVSTLIVYVTYLLGREIYDERAGLVGAFMMAVFWDILFASGRILTYLYSPLCYNLAAFFFWKWWKTKEQKWLNWTAIIAALGISIYYSIGFIIIPIVVFLFSVEHFKFLKNKQIWVAALIGLPFLLLPMIPSYLIQHSLIPRLTQVEGIVQTETGAGLMGAFTYLLMMPGLLLPAFLVMFTLSRFLTLRVGVFFDKILGRKQTALKRLDEDFYLSLVSLTPFVIYTLLSMIAGGTAGAQYDLWILSIFPAMFIGVGRFFFMAADSIGNKYGADSKKFFTVLFIIVLLFGGYQHISQAYNSITSKSTTYYNLRPAGEWLKENSAPNDLFYSAAVPELTYYSQREVMGHDTATRGMTQDEFIQALQMRKPVFYVLTIWEKSPDYAMMLPYQNVTGIEFTPANAFFLDAAHQQPDVIIWRMDYSNATA